MKTKWTKPPSKALMSEDSIKLREQCEQSTIAGLEQRIATERAAREQAEVKLAAAYAVMDKGANIGWGNAVTVEIVRQQTLRESAERERDALKAENEVLRARILAGETLP